MPRPAPRASLPPAVATTLGLACALASAGCLAIPLSTTGPGGAVADGDDASLDTFTADTATTNPVWGVEGELVLEGGSISSGSSLQLATRGVSCDVRAQLARTQAIALTASQPDLLQLWRIDVTLDPEASCTWLGPTTLLLGLGPTSPALRPAAARAGLDADRGYGLLLGTVDRDPLLVGLAATAAQLDGTEPLVGEAPLPDGAYQLVTLHGIPVVR